LVNLVRQEVGAEQSPYSLVSRLFRNHPDISFSRPYHALVDESVSLILSQEPGWKVGYLSEVAILHEGYQANAIAGRDKFQKAQTAMEGFLASHPSDPYVCSKLGALYVQVGDLQRGLALLKRGLTSTQLTPSIAYELHYHLGIAYSRLQDRDQATAHYQAAVQQPILGKLKLGAYNNWGNLLKVKGDLLGARTAYQTVLQIDPSLAAGHYNLGMTLKAMGHLEEAIAVYKQAIQLQPNHAEAYQNLGVTLWNLGKVSESLSAFRQAIALHQQHNPLEAQRLRQGLKEIGFAL
jgi:tetratricopeptide (TPR) repeat protein